MQNIILILGGGINKNGLNKRSKERLDKALEIYQQTDKVLISSRYGFYTAPPISEKGFPIDDAYVEADYLVSKGVAKESILIENNALDTIGNMYFSRVNHLTWMNFDKITLVTSNFHMQRSKILFDWVMSLTPVMDSKFAAEFVTAEDSDEDGELGRLLASEEKKIVSLAKHMEGITTMKKFHQWFYSIHEAYAYPRAF